MTICRTKTQVFIDTQSNTILVRFSASLYAHPWLFEANYNVIERNKTVATGKMSKTEIIK